jgi:hypothetical protein
MILKCGLNKGGYTQQNGALAVGSGAQLILVLPLRRSQPARRPCAAFVLCIHH